MKKSNGSDHPKRRKDDDEDEDAERKRCVVTLQRPCYIKLRVAASDRGISLGKMMDELIRDADI